MARNKKLAGWMAVLALVNSTAFGEMQEPSRAPFLVDPFVGSYQDSIAIAVPPFHGIEPHLSLDYSSSAGNGYVGVGWQLSGLNTVERASPGKGSPRYDATDIFLLDGQELIPCPNSGASCAPGVGGTHATKIESYQRIQLNSGTNTWTITGKDGTRRILTPVHNTPSGTFRWGLTSVVDTHNNTVTYTWASLDDSYPVTISYNQTTVRVWWEVRPDNRFYATGVNLARTSKRVRSIDVLVSGVRARIYKLSYTTSVNTQRSLLSNVQMFGKDAVVNDEGLVSGGSALPILTFGYSDAQSGTYRVPPSYTPWSGYAMGSGNWLVGDHNGDGKRDLIHFWVGGNQAHTFVSNGDGTYRFSFTTIPNDGFTNWQGGDVDCDGKYDLMATQGDRIYTLISDGNGGYSQRSYQPWPGYAMNWGIFESGDVDGDCKTDFIHITGGDYLNTFLSNGDGTYRLVTFSPRAGYPNSQGTWQVGEFNGDNRADLIHFFGGHADIFLSRGDGTFTVVTFNPPETLYPDDTFILTDVQGDGRSDVLHIGPPNHPSAYLWQSRGNGQFDAALQPQLTAGILPSDIWRTVDTNGDGIPDLVQIIPALNRVVNWISSGDGNYSAIAASYPIGWQPVFVTGDFNGDGKGDVAQMTEDQIRTWFAEGSVGNLMTSTTNGIGGLTRISYVPSSAWTTSNNPPILQTVSWFAVSDGRASDPTTTSFEYSGGRFDWVDRRFLGFGYSKTLKPCITGETRCPYDETEFRQDYGSVSKPKKIYHRDGDGTLLRLEEFDYTTNGTTVPYISLGTGTHVHEYDRTGGSRETYVERSFDSYGNVLTDKNYGDVTVSAGRYTTSRSYLPNASLYIVDRPGSVRIYQGLGTEGTLLKSTLFYYDGADAQVPPTVGDLTKTARWVDPSDTYTWVNRQFEYDDVGNRKAITEWINGLPSRSTADYDATYHVYPITQTNALQQSSTLEWDAQCGAVKRTIDPNQAEETADHDQLCRLRRKDFPLGGFEIHSYVLGNPDAQYEKIETNPADDSGNLWTINYFDGLGRTYLSVAKGPAADLNINAQTAFNARGFVSGRTAPYYAGAALQWTTQSYDGLDRVVMTRAPDGASVRKTYGVGAETTLDPLDHQVQDNFDGFGRLTSHREWHDGQPNIVSYEYDARGNLWHVTDPAGNVTTTLVDSLGRVYSQNDPDSGLSTLRYYETSHLKSKTDANGQLTTFDYDLLGRKTAKTSLAGTDQAVTVTWTYDEVVTGASNKGRLTSTSYPGGYNKLNYDAAGRLVNETRTIDGIDYTFSIAFDVNGRVQHVDYPDGDSLGPMTYDGAGRLKSIPGILTRADYDAAGRVTQQLNANNTTTTKSYNLQRGWLDSILTANSVPVTLQRLTYDHDAEEKVRQVSSISPDESWTYEYDDMHFLRASNSTDNPELSQTFTYDVLGNIKSNSRLGNYTYPDPGQPQPNAVTSAGGTTYRYDSNGNMLQGSQGPITWDGDNRVVSVAGLQMAYDADGLRFKKVVSGVPTVYLGDDVEISSGVLTKFIRLQGNVIATRVANVTHWLHTDSLGSVQLETNDAGNPEQAQKYRAYGEIFSPFPSFPEPLGYAGERQDESGLLYLHARYMDPVLGRFISPDPVRQEGLIGLNPYAYAKDSPTNFSDTSGMDSCQRGICIDVGYNPDGSSGYHQSRVTYDSNALVALGRLIGRAISHFFHWLFGGGDDHQGPVVPRGTGATHIGHAVPRIGPAPPPPPPAPPPHVQEPEPTTPTVQGPGPTPTPDNTESPHASGDGHEHSPNLERANDILGYVAEHMAESRWGVRITRYKELFWALGAKGKVGIAGTGRALSRFSGFADVALPIYRLRAHEITVSDYRRDEVIAFFGLTPVGRPIKKLYDVGDFLPGGWAGTGRAAGRLEQMAIGARHWANPLCDSLMCGY